MRAQLLAVVLLGTAIVQTLSAQTAPPPMKTFIASGEIATLVAKAKAERKPEQPMVAEPILSLAPYRAQIEYRPGVSPATVHEKDAEVMYVLEGAGNIVIGGKLVEEKRTNASNLAGTSIEGGKPQPVAKGDYVFVPENTPHQVIPAGGSIVLITMHVPRPAANWP